jgi:glutamate racemase
MPGTAPTILVFDSGLGGLTVFREIVKARPDARYIYLADDAAFPYGNIPEDELVERVLRVIGGAIEKYSAELVVVACNTASTLALAQLRAKYSVPFIGTVPAIKPACTASRSRVVAVLGTQATVSREYTKGLIREFAQGCEVRLVGAAKLASFAEAELHGEPASNAAIAAEIAPCFVEENGRRTDTIVLACTHYPLLLDRMRKLAPWPVDWIDPAPAIARRLVELVGPPTASKPPAPAQMIFTSGVAPSAKLKAALKAFGIT